MTVPEAIVNLAREVAMRKQSTRATVEAVAPLIAAAALKDLEDWCTEHAAHLPGPTGQADARPTPASDAVWDVIDEIRRRLAKATGE